MDNKDRSQEKMKYVWCKGGDWSFPNFANVYFESQDEYTEEPFISIRGGALSCFHSAKEDALNEFAEKHAKLIVDRWNAGIEKEVRKQ